MLKVKTLATLLVLTLGLGAGLWYLQPSKYSNDKALISQADLERVRTIKIKDNQKITELVYSGDHWKLRNMQDYPATEEYVLDFLSTLQDARIIEAKTANPFLHRALDLEDVELSDSKARTLILADENGQEILNIVVGKRDFDSNFIRFARDKQTWLVANLPVVSTEFQYWVRALLLPELEFNNLKTVRVIDGNKTLRFDKSIPTQEDFKPEGADFVAALVDADYKAVVETNSNIDWNNAKSVELETFDGKQYNLQYLSNNDLKLVKLSMQTLIDDPDAELESTSFNSDNANWLYVLNSDLSLP